MWPTKMCLGSEGKVVVVVVVVVVVLQGGDFSMDGVFLHALKWVGDGPACPRCQNDPFMALSSENI